MWGNLYYLGRTGLKCLFNEGWSTFRWNLTRYLKYKKDYQKSYKLWMKKNEPCNDDLDCMRIKSNNFLFKPKISIVMPVWNTDRIWLSAAIESVLNQVYDNWELCISEGGSNEPHVREILDSYALKTDKIKLKYLDHNKGISGNSNEALSLASGDFVGFLDHDDELAPFALYEVISLLNKNGILNFVYSDEDKITDKGIRIDPFFKPDWSPDLFLSCNYLCHFSVIRRDLINEVGGFREGYDGSQDYDLFLRVIESIEEDKIGHITKILYHWRITPSSSAFSCKAKPYANIAAKRALKDAMMRRGVKIDEVVDGLSPGTYRVNYKINNNDMRISIVVHTQGDVKTLDDCIKSVLMKTNYTNYEIIVIISRTKATDKSAIEYYSQIERHPKIRVLEFSEFSGQLASSKINNYAASKINAEYILFLDENLEVVDSDWLSSMLEHVQRKEVGAVGAKLCYSNKKIEHAGIVIGVDGLPLYIHRGFPASAHGYFNRLQMVQDFSAISASCMLTKKTLFLEVNGFDEEHLGPGLNAVDYCLKLREKGYLIVYTPYAELKYSKSIPPSHEKNHMTEKVYLNEASYIREKWGETLKIDPYYNPNLASNKNDFSIKIK